MSSLYLVRHGQAGLRRRYDELSAVGREQSRRLGQYLAAQEVSFRAIYSGALVRQRETAEEAIQAYRAAGPEAPEIAIDESWNEFDLDAVYREYAPRLCEEDERFRIEYEELSRHSADENHPIQRTWGRCDILVVRAWVEGRYPCSGESWVDFQQRVSRGLVELSQYGRGDNVAVFTSATPIGVWTGAALNAEPRIMMRLAGVLYNSAMTTLRLREQELTLFSFNGTAHLDRRELKTFR